MPTPIVYWPQTYFNVDESTLWLALGCRINDHTYCVVQLVNEKDLKSSHSLPNGITVLGYCGKRSDERQIKHKSELVVTMYAATMKGKNMFVPSISVRDQQYCHVIFYDANLGEKGHIACLTIGDNGSNKALSTSLHTSLECIRNYYNALAEQQQRTMQNQIKIHGNAACLDIIGKNRMFWIRANPSATYTRSVLLRTMGAVVGYYGIYLPFTVLQWISAIVNTFVSMPFPALLPVIGEKCLMVINVYDHLKTLNDLSHFVAVANLQFYAFASFPSHFRRCYQMSRTHSLTIEERTKRLELWNSALNLVLDFVVGRLLASLILQLHTTYLQNEAISPIGFLNMLRVNVAWLMGAPAGFKLNPSLASILGNGVLLWLDLWGFLFLQMADFGHAINLHAKVASWLLWLWPNVCATLQLTLLFDIVTFCTWNSLWVFLYFTKLNLLQFRLFGSLWKLFLGKKNNVLRKRVDSCEYDVSQLLLGTLLFTILFFIVTTNMVFFVYFGLVRLGIFFATVLLWLPILILRVIPWASLFYRLWNPSSFVSGLEIQICEDLLVSIDEVTVEDVIFGGATDPKARLIHLQQIFQKDKQQQIPPESRGDIATTTYFQLVPIRSPCLGLFSRLRCYMHALTTHYSINGVVRSWTATSPLGLIPLRILFDHHPVGCGDTIDKCSTTSKSKTE